MEGGRKRAERALRRCYEGHRLEDQLWSMAYERVFPVIRRPLVETSQGPSSACPDEQAAWTRIAKGA